MRCGLISAKYRGTITSLVLLVTSFLIQQPAFHKPMLAASDHSIVPLMPCDDIQDDLLHKMPCYQTDSSAIPELSFLPFVQIADKFANLQSRGTSLVSQDCWLIIEIVHSRSDTKPRAFATCWKYLNSQQVYKMLSFFFSFPFFPSED